MTIPSETWGLLGTIATSVIMMIGGYLRARIKERMWQKKVDAELALANVPPTSRPELPDPPDVGPLVVLIAAIGAAGAVGHYAPRAIEVVQKPQAAGAAPTQRCNPAACKRAGGECRGGVCTKAAETDRPAVRAVPHVSAVDAVVMLPAGSDREPI